MVFGYVLEGIDHGCQHLVLDVFVDKLFIIPFLFMQKKKGNDWWVMQIMTVWNDYTMH